MTDDAAQQGGEEDLFDQWLAHRDGEPPSSGQLRSTTVPPTWAPRVVAPRPEPETLLPDPEPPLAEPVAVETVAVETVAVETVAPAPVVIPAPEPAVASPEPVTIAAPEAEPLHQDPPDQLRVPEPRRTEPPLREKGEQEPPVRLTFRPRTRARTAVGLGMALAAAASVAASYIALRVREDTSTGIAVTLWVLTGIIWAVHSGTSVTRLSVRGGQLQVTRQGVRTTIDLTSTYTPVEVYGRPGKHGWKVVFRRHDMSPFVIDPSMVDPAEFMRVLRYYRPGVDAGPE